MAINDINRPEYVMQAIAEFDKLGRWRFLFQYGFNAARRYFIQYNERLYDSKAVIGVAHRYARPSYGALKASEFTGGMATVVAKLQDLGFVVEKIDGSEVDEQPLGEAVGLVIVENEVTVDGTYDHWEDLTGVEYHFPNIYKNRVLLGRPFIYYRGVRRRDGSRGRAEYFGVGRIGDKWPATGNATVERKRDWTWYCSIIDYIPFQRLVPATHVGRSRFEEISNARDWQVGIRYLPLESFTAILVEAGVDKSWAIINRFGESIVNNTSILPLESVQPTIVQSGNSLLDKQALPAISLGLSIRRGGLQRYSRQSKLIGDRAEEIVLRWLSTNLPAKCQASVRWVAAQGELPGWDIEYVNQDGDRCCVEVKGTSGNSFPTVGITANEWRAAVTEGDRYHLYLVADCLGLTPRIEIIRNPASLVENGAMTAEPIAWALARSTEQLESRSLTNH